MERLTRSNAVEGLAAFIASPLESTLLGVIEDEMTDRQRYLISVIESPDCPMGDYTGVGGDGVLATKLRMRSKASLRLWPTREATSNEY